MRVLLAQVILQSPPFNISTRRNRISKFHIDHLRQSLQVKQFTPKRLKNCNHLLWIIIATPHWEHRRSI